MYMYWVYFYGGKRLAATRVDIQKEGIRVYDYMRKGTLYSKDEIEKVEESRVLYGVKEEKTIYKGR